MSEFPRKIFFPDFLWGGADLYCNAVFAGAPKTMLQRVLNAWSVIPGNSTVVCRDSCIPIFIGWTFLNVSNTNYGTFAPKNFRSRERKFMLPQIQARYAYVPTPISHAAQLRLITRSLSVDAAVTLVQSFISCHLDYCNSLFSGITDNLLGRLQSVHRHSSM